MGVRKVFTTEFYLSKIHPILTNRRVLIYAFAFFIRVLFASFFIDKFDGAVFIDTGNDILLKNTGIYSEGSLQSKFNYFPLAYLAILPGQALYNLLGFNNLIVQRIFLKLPLIFADLALAHIAVSKLEHEGKFENKYKEQIASQGITKAELFILFNPVLIFTASIKGQFDIYPTIFILLGWRKFKDKSYVKAGFLLGISILFKQYAILVIFFFGLSLLKRNFRKLPKFVFGQLLAVVPILTIAAIINFEGLLDHAIKFHLERPPTGLSLTSIVYNPLTSALELSYSSILSIFVGNIIILVFKMALIVSLLYLGYNLLLSDNEDKDILRTLIYAFVLFFLLNNVFWTQYFIVMIVLLFEYKREIGEDISDTMISWNYALVPVAIIFRVFTMTADDVKAFLGDLAIIIIWFIGVTSHFIVMLILRHQKANLFPNRYIKTLYGTFLIILPIHLWAMVNLGQLLGLLDV